MKMTMKAVLAAGAFALAAAGGAHAQTATPGAANPEMPSKLECDNGYKEDMRWSKEDFEAACIKVRTNAVPAGQSK